MSDFDWKRAGGVFGAGYFKQWVDPYLDDFLRQPSVAAILSAHPGMRAGGQSLLHALRGYLEQKVTGQTVLSAFFKAALQDSISELASQMSQSADKELGQLTGPANPEPVKQVATRLLGLDPEVRSRLLLAISDMNDQDRAAFLSYLESASPSDFEAFSVLPREEQASLLGLHSLSQVGLVGGLWATLRTVLGSFGQMAGAFLTKGKDLGLEVLDRYLCALVWTFSASGVLLVLAFFACGAATLLEQNSLSLALVVLAVVAGGLAFAGKTLKASWLIAAGAFGVLVLLLAASLSLAGYQDSIYAIVFLFLVGGPLATMAVVFLPLSMFIQALRQFSLGYEAFVRPLQVVFTIMLAVLLLPLALLLFPPSNPVAFLFIAGFSVFVAAMASLGLVKVNPEQVLTVPVLAGVFALVVLASVFMSMPNRRAQVSDLFARLDNVAPPVAVAYNNSAEIVFVTSNGKALIWYALRPGGGYDLFSCDGICGKFVGDGRKLKLADDEASRQAIRDWVDAEAARKQAREHSEVEANRQQQVASYLAPSTGGPEVDYMVAVAAMSGEPMSELAHNLVGTLRGRGKTATADSFATPFYTTGAFERVFTGQGGADLTSMGLHRLGDKLLMARLDDSELVDSVPGRDFQLHISRSRLLVRVLDANSGRVQEQFTLMGEGRAESHEFAKRQALQQVISNFEAHRL